MIEPSDEQKTVVSHLSQGENVVVDAVAGSGKSTTVLAVALAMPDVKILHLTYNALLRSEFRAKCTEVGAHNIEVHTYHSLANHYFCEVIDTDTKLVDVWYKMKYDENPKMPREVPAFGLLVLDELQDCSKLYFEFAIWFAARIPRKIQLLCLGDVRQKIYGFKGADHRFLTHAAELWSGCPALLSFKFVYCSLHTTYRATIPIAQFVNCALIGEARLRTDKPGPRVSYICHPRTSIIKELSARIKRIIASGASPNDIFVLSNTLNCDLVCKLENALVARKIPCHISMHTEPNDRIAAHKVAFSTYHKCKGRQRRFVFVLGFESVSWGDNSDTPWGQCPNTLYVACTRATEQLFVVESSTAPFVKPPTTPEFLRISYAGMREMDFIECIGDTYGKPATPPSKDSTLKPKDINISTDRFYLSGTAEIDISRLLAASFEQVQLDNATISTGSVDIPEFMCTQSRFCENVNDINCLSITSMFYDSISPRIASDSMYAYIRSADKTRMDRATSMFLESIMPHFERPCVNVSDYLRVATISTALHTNFHSTMMQIRPDEYTWLEQDQTRQCIEWLDIVMGADLRAAPFCLNTTVCNNNTNHSHIHAELYKRDALFRKFFFTATVDVVSHSALWIIVCTSTISTRDWLRTALTAWVWRMTHSGSDADKEVYILNIRTKEQFRVAASTDALTEIATTFLREKYGDKLAIPDDEFVAECRIAAGLNDN